MSRAVFEAVDPHQRKDGASQLKTLLQDVHGVVDWNLDRNGVVTVEYDPEETSSNVIEEALAGIGYRIQHISDSERLGEADAPNLGVSEKPGRGVKYGKSSDMEAADRTRRSKP